MEPRFVCEYKPTVKKLAEHTRKLQPARVIIYMVIGVLFFFYIATNAWKFGFQGIWKILFLIGVLYLGWALAMPEINAFLSIKRTEKNMGSYPVYKITFGDSIEIVEGTVRILWEYADIREVKRYKHTYVLLKNKHMGIPLDPDGFTMGTFGEFKQFLREKCPNISIPE